MLCKCQWIVLYTVHFTAFCLGGGRFFPGHGVLIMFTQMTAWRSSCLVLMSPIRCKSYSDCILSGWCRSWRAWIDSAYQSDHVGCLDCHWSTTREWCDVDRTAFCVDHSATATTATHVRLVWNGSTSLWTRLRLQKAVLLLVLSMLSTSTKINSC